MNSNYYMKVNTNIMKILWRQFQDLMQKSPEGVYPILNEEDPSSIEANILGPQSTPYEKGLFRVKLIFLADFPMTPPKGYFITKIYHPNVSERGEICVNTLGKDWNQKNWSLYNLFEVIKCLMIIPFPESSLNEEAGKLFMENYDEYSKIARIYTEVHALNKKRNDDDGNSFSLMTPIIKKNTSHFNVIISKSNDDKNNMLNRKRILGMNNIIQMKNDLGSSPQKTNEEIIQKWLGRI